MRTKIFTRFKWAAIILLSILSVGTIGYWYIWHGEVNLVDCLYMTVITITTIGFQEVRELNGNTFGRIFTIIIAFLGIGTSTYIISNITALIVEGDLKETFKRRKIEKKINKMTNHYIICGVGRVGSHILKELRLTGRETAVIDNDENLLREISLDYPGLNYIHGDADTEDILNKAGIMTASGLFASTGDDNQNLVISLTAKYLNPNIRVIARCLDAANNTKMKKAGADTVVSENFIAGMRMASEMIRPTVVTFLDKMLRNEDKNLRVEEVNIGEKYTGKRLEELNIIDYEETMLLAITSGDQWIYNPKKDHVIKENSKLVIITNAEDRQKMDRNIG